MQGYQLTRLRAKLHGLIVIHVLHETRCPGVGCVQAPISTLIVVRYPSQRNNEPTALLCVLNIISPLVDDHFDNRTTPWNWLSHSVMSIKPFLHLS